MNHLLIFLLVITGLLVLMHIPQTSESTKARALTVLVALDVFLFAVCCFGKAKIGECASSAAWDCLAKDKWQGHLFVPIINALFFFDPDHCHASWKWQQFLYEPMRLRFE